MWVWGQGEARRPPVPEYEGVRLHQDYQDQAGSAGVCVWRVCLRVCGEGGPGAQLPPCLVGGPAQPPSAAPLTPPAPLTHPASLTYPASVTHPTPITHPSSCGPWTQ